MNALPVREMVLYKHGVGFFVREGEVNSSSVILTFRQDEVNDVLKSLAVFDRAGGQVLGIHYQTPMDRAARMANTSIHLSDRASLRDLIRDLRGRWVALEFVTQLGETEEVQGRIIGLDLPEQLPNQPGVYAASLLSVLVMDDLISVYDLDTLRSIMIRDSQSEHDLTYFLDTSMSEDTRRTVTIRLSEGEHQLVMHYVAPSPTWRVSYRVVAESDEQETGKAALQGWGLFDNRLEEDLDDVQVTLVAGQPISFIYNLYDSRIPERPTVQDESRIAPKPVEYRGGGSLLRRIEKPPAAEGVIASAPMRMQKQAFSASSADMPGRIREQLLARTPPDKRDDKAYIEELFETILAEENLVMSRNERQRLFESVIADVLGGQTVDWSASIQAGAEGRESGEFFQYVVTAPVSVKRGESALVPIIDAEISYNRELLYNRAKLPNHPVAALRFMNITGLTLERGPVTVVENGDYKGEAVVPFTKDGSEVYLPYAVELGIRITERVKNDTETIGLNIQNQYMIFEQHQIQRTTYILENSTAKTLIITIEAPIQNGYELFDMSPPDVETAAERRWRVEVPGRSKTEFVRSERTRTHRRERLSGLQYKDLQKYFQQNWLDQQAFDRLSEMLTVMASITQMTAEQEKLKAERQSLYEKQEQLRANLSTLQASGEEAALRGRMLSQLETSQNRLEEIDTRMQDIITQINAAQQKVDAIIAGIG